jgi:hypothetical protein
MLVPDLIRASSKVVQHLSCNPEMEGLNPAAIQYHKNCEDKKHLFKTLLAAVTQ